MQEIFKKLYARMNEGKIIVMPSEDARRRLLLSYAQYEKKTISSQSAIASDTFISYFFPENEKLLKADLSSRLVFASYIVSKKRKYLPYLIPDNVSSMLDSRLIHSIASLLPHLEEEGALPFRKAEADLNFLRKEYGEYLSRSGLYEPSFISNAKPFDGPYVLFCPECDMALSEFLSRAGRRSLVGKGIEIVSSECDVSRPLYVYRNEREEIRDTFAFVRALLDHGEDQDEIAITCSNTEGLRKHIEREARLFSVPILFQRGRKVLEYPVGSILKSVREIAENSFDIDSLKGFFLNPSLPFKDRKSVRTFIKKAISGSVTRRKESNDRYLSFDENGVYRTLLHYVQLITGAKDSDDLSDGIMGMMERFFGRNAFEDSVEDGPVMSFIISQLGQLREAMKKAEILGYGTDANVFSLFLSVLESAVYVPQKREKGVRILSLGDAIGFPLSYHFVIDLNEKEGVYSARPLSYFSDFELAGKRKERDMLLPLLSSYEKSADNLIISASVETYRGNMLPSMKIGKKIYVGKGGGDDPFLIVGRMKRGEDVSLFLDEYTLERKINRREYRGRISYPLQRKSFYYALSSALDTEKLRFCNSIVWDRHFPIDIRFEKYSFSQVDRFFQCHYQYLLVYYMGLDKVCRYRSDDFPHLEIGTRLHNIIERYFSSGSRCVDDLDDLFSLEMDLWEKRLVFDKRTGKNENLPVNVQDLTPLLRKYIENKFLINMKTVLLSLEEVVGNGYIPSVERNVVQDIAGRKFNAYIDLMLENDDDVILIDFKKGSLAPRNKLQFDIYSSLVEKDSGKRVLTTEYAMLGSGKIETHKLLPKEELEEKISTFFSKLEEGDFHASKDARNCASCPFRGICRRRFFIQ